MVPTVQQQQTIILLLTVFLSSRDRFFFHDALNLVPSLKNTSDGNIDTVLHNKVLLSFKFFLDISIETIDPKSLLYTIQ